MLFKHKSTGRIIEANTVQVHNQGGGFVEIITIAELYGEYEPTTLETFYPAKVDAEWFPYGYSAPCYTDGRKWNGSGMPYFEKSAILDFLSLGYMPGTTYNEEHDCFITDLEGETEECHATTILVGGKSIKVYPLGAGSWTWYQCEPVSKEK